jgi:hypothetical protein
MEQHEPGCPATYDDESDYEFLYDAGECCCKFRSLNSEQPSISEQEDKNGSHLNR